MKGLAMVKLLGAKASAISSMCWAIEQACRQDQTNPYIIECDSDYVVIAVRNAVGNAREYEASI